MSFWPLPTSLIDSLRAAGERGPTVDLGAGEGRFSRRLNELGLHPLLLDHRLAASPARPCVRADLRVLPFRPASTGLFVLANSLRHVQPQEWRPAAEGLWRTLVPGGALAILEDEPDADAPAEVNYRWTLRLLARVDDSRGHAVHGEAVRGQLAAVCGEPRRAGRAVNREPVEDPLLPVRWMRSLPRLPFAADELNALEASVRRSGMAYGTFWFQVYGKDRA